MKTAINYTFHRQIPAAHLPQSLPPTGPHPSLLPPSSTILPQPLFFLAAPTPPFSSSSLSLFHSPSSTTPLPCLLFLLELIPLSLLLPTPHSLVLLFLFELFPFSLTPSACYSPLLSSSPPLSLRLLATPFPVVGGSRNVAATHVRNSLRMHRRSVG